MEIFFKWEADIASYYQYNRNIISSAREQSFKNKLPACRHITIAKFFKVYVSFVQQNGGICQPLLLLVFVLLLVLQEVTADSFLSHPLIYPTCPLFKMLVSPPPVFHSTPFYDIWYSFTLPQPLPVNPPASSNIPTSPAMKISISSNQPQIFKFWWYKPKLNPLAFFFILLHHWTDYFCCLEWLYCA